MSEDESDLYDFDLGFDLVVFVVVVFELSIDEIDGGGEDVDVLVYVVGVGFGNFEYLMFCGW